MEIGSFKERYNNTVIIMGNGPSLGDENLLAWGQNYVTFGSNRVYLSGYVPDYYCCVNPLVLGQYKAEIADLYCTKFISKQAAEAVGFENENGEVVLIDTSERRPGFYSPEGPLWEGHTVTFVMLQLAHYMGFQRAALIGVDHDFGERGKYQPNLELAAVGPDTSHFHPDYFSGGARWNAPDLASSEAAYSLARAAWELDGRKIVNASKRTKLEVFPLQRHIENNRPRVSAIISAYKCPVAWLEGTLDDLGAQTEDVEMVVVCEAGSELFQAAVDWTERYKWFDRVKIVKTADTPTIYRAWNLGIEAARGKYLVNANTDDRRNPRALQMMADVLDARADIDVVYGDSFITWDEPMTYEEFCGRYALVDLALGRTEGKPGVFLFGDYSRRRLMDGCFMGPQPMWRASLHQVHGGFLETWQTAADYEFWLRVAKERNMMHLPAILGVYCARLGGAELRDPVLALDEARMAQALHQDPDGVELKPVGGGLVGLAIGGRYAFVRPGDLRAALAQASGEEG